MVLVGVLGNATLLKTSDLPQWFMQHNNSLILVYKLNIEIKIFKLINSYAPWHDHSLSMLNLWTHWELELNSTITNLTWAHVDCVQSPG